MWLSWKEIESGKVAVSIATDWKVDVSPIKKAPILIFIRCKSADRRWGAIVYMYVGVRVLRLFTH